MIKRCEHCGDDFESVVPWQKYCSKVCAAAAYAAVLAEKRHAAVVRKHTASDRRCVVCGGPIPPDAAKYYTMKTCSPLCRRRWFKERRSNEIQGRGV